MLGESFLIWSKGTICTTNMKTTMSEKCHANIFKFKIIIIIIMPSKFDP